MHLLRDMPIERKMTVITMVTTSLALLLACAAFLAYERSVSRTTSAHQLESTAAMLADNSTAALSFQDKEAAEKTLESLSAQPHLVAAVIYDPAGHVFATYQRGGARTAFRAPPTEADGYRYDRSRLRVFGPITLGGERLGTIYVESDLAEMRARFRNYAWIVAMVMGAASVLAYLLSSSLQTAISGPISDLARVVGVVAAEKTYAVRAVKQGKDELGRLIDGFNEMLDQIQAQDGALNEARDNLERRVDERTEELRREIVERENAEDQLRRTHQQLLEASRLGGMAEIATNVLHNVGNVLNSVNVSAGLVSESMKKHKAAGLIRVVALLREHDHDLGDFISRDSRGRSLPAYLAELSEQIEADHRVSIGELDLLRTNIEHIKEIVAMQQSYAKVSGLKELVNLVDLVEDSLRMNVGGLTRHGVELTREFAEVPLLNLEKHKVLQILVNLIRNAKYACDESGRSDKRVTLHVTNGGGKVRVTVADNGVGIPAENLTRIFNHGFTTRELGHGFGLHSGALAAAELGGSLTVHSAGTGEGASFTLELPCPEPAVCR